MNTVEKIEHWGDAHHGKWLDIIRVILGLIIFLKGISFISDTDALKVLFVQNNIFGFSGLLAMALTHIIAFAHLVGGIFIVLGLLTRFAVVVLIPVLLGAVFFVNISKGFSFVNSELWLSVIVLFLLILFWIIGSGPYSVDHWMKTNPSK